jgi:hypothetical protein
MLLTRCPGKKSAAKAEKMEERVREVRARMNRG